VEGHDTDNRGPLSRRSTPFVLLALACIVAGGLAVRVTHLGRECPYWDEIASLDHLNAPDLPTFLRQERVDDPPMVPFYFAVEYCWARCTGGSVLAMRWLSVICGVAGIVMIYLLGALLYDSLVGLVAALCFSLSVTHVYAAAEIRPYALLMLLAMGSAYALARALRGDGPRWWAVNVVCNVLIMWTHLFSVLFLAAQGCYLLVRCVREKALSRFAWWALAHVPSAILLLFWVRSIDRAQLEVAAVWRLKMVHSYLMPLGDFLLCIGAGVPTFRDVPAFGPLHMGGILWRVFLPVLPWVMLATFLAWRRKRPEPDRAVASFWFLLPWLVIPPAALFLVSALVYSCHSSRYVMYSAIPFAIFTGVAVKFLRTRSLRILAVCFLIGIYGFNLYAHPGPWRHDFRGAADYLKLHMAKDDALMVYHAVDIAALRFDRGDGFFPETVKGFGELSEARDYFATELKQHPTTRTWFVLGQRVDSQRDIEAVTSAIKENAAWVHVRRFGYVRPVYVFQIDP